MGDDVRLVTRVAGPTTYRLASPSPSLLASPVEPSPATPARAEERRPERPYGAVVGRMVRGSGAQGTRLGFEVTGVGRRTIVLLHGLAGYGGEWAACARLLEERHRVIVMDLRAHGASTSHPEDLSREAFADDVVAVLDAEGAEEPVIMVGQSMGAHTALVVAERHPDRVARLVMIEGDVGGGGPGRLEEVVAAMASIPTSFSTLEHVADFFGGGEPGRAWAGGYEERDGRWFSRFDASLSEAVMAPLLLTERWHAWQGLGVPVDLILAERSVLDPLRTSRMLELRPGTGHHVVQSAGHDVHLEQPAAVAAVLERLVRAHRADVPHDRDRDRDREHER